MTQIFIPKEIRELETRVAATSETVKKLVSSGFAVSVESGAGEKSFISDQNFIDAGATLSSDLSQLYAAADIVMKVAPPTLHANGKHEVDMMREGSILICHLVPQNEMDSIKKLLARKISCISMNLIPRITIAQKMDSLSSQPPLPVIRPC